MVRNEKTYLAAIAVLIVCVVSLLAVVQNYRTKYSGLLASIEKSKEEKSGPAAKNARADIGEKMSRLGAMQKTLAEKEEKIRSLEKEIAKPKPAVVSDGGKKPQSAEEMYADMKRNNPESYSSFVESYRRMASAVSENNSAQRDFFAGIDTTGYTDEQMKNHQALLEKLENFGLSLEKFQTSEDVLELSKIISEKMNFMREINPLVKVEKEAAIMALGRSIGYSYDEAAQFRDYLAYLDKMASTPGVYIFNSGTNGQGQSTTTISVGVSAGE